MVEWADLGIINVWKNPLTSDKSDYSLTKISWEKIFKFSLNAIYWMQTRATIFVRA